MLPVQQVLVHTTLNVTLSNSNIKWSIGIDDIKVLSILKSTLYIDGFLFFIIFGYIGHMIREYLKLARSFNAVLTAMSPPLGAIAMQQYDIFLFYMTCYLQTSC